jgi:hypothetical protein
MTAEQRRERVLSFLYGQMDPVAAEGSGAELARDPDLRRLLADEERFERTVPRGQAASVSATSLRETRLLVRAALRREQRRRSLR